MERWRDEEMDTLRHGEMERWRNTTAHAHAHGDLERWRDGDMEKCPFRWVARGRAIEACENRHATGEDRDGELEKYQCPCPCPCHIAIPQTTIKIQSLPKVSSMTLR